VFPKSPEQLKKRLGGDGSNVFVFCERSTGMAHFRAEAKTDRTSTVERIAGVFAMQCLVRGHDPEDFLVLVPAKSTVVGRLVTRAKELLEEGRMVANPASLSPRQSEILHSVIRNRANKEIASTLNITVRTVKFHISSLLNKFDVNNRAELARKAAGLLHQHNHDDLSSQQPLERRIETQLKPPISMDRAARVASKASSVTFPGRVLSA
jgi:DNA-binding CsgD family transcriptional regulator